MSNYPPGVTGNEPEIRGHDEAEIHRECLKQTSFRVIPHTDWGALKHLFRSANRIVEGEKDGEILNVSRTQILRDIQNIEKWLGEWDEKYLSVEVDECEFEGWVEAQYNSYSIWWECPLCGSEHEEDIDEIG